MNKKAKLKLCALTLATTLGALTALTSVQEVQAAVVSNGISSTATANTEDIKIINEDTFEVDGVTYSISTIANSIKDNSANEDTIQPMSIPTAAAKVAMKKGVKWLLKNKTLIMSKLPVGLRKYINIDKFVKAADKFIGISSGFEDLLHKVFRSWGMPEGVNKIITNIIMIAGPL
ncbi:hypothetical protein [Clostridium estertheticum]|uniref:hypothetical protein n=1 Tax=Clostridium estertheticum TaxID=238834 RepID=UPI001C0DE42E|nr:hypothetical protein [Clostridium estertheticum]MBU3183279.1 hypothetical protein [Clostridium estertheticum]